MFNKIKEKIQKDYNMIENNATRIFNKCALEARATTSVHSTKTKLTIINSITSIKTLYNKDKVVFDYGFVLFNELRNTNPNKQIRIDSNSSVIIDYSGCEMILSIFKNEDDVLLNVKFGNDEINFKYDFKQVVDVITNDKIIKEMGEVVTIKQKEYTQNKVVACTTAMNKKEESTKESIIENIGAKLFEDGQGINIQIIHDNPINIIKPEVINEPEQQYVSHEEDNIFARFKKKQEQKDILKEIIENIQQSQIEQEELIYGQTHQQYCSDGIYQQYMDYGWY